MTIKNFALAAMSAAALYAAAPAAQASSVTLDYEGTNAWGSPNWSRGVTYTLDGAAKSHGAGLFRLVDTSNPTEAILAFCIDLLQVLQMPNDHDVHTTFTTAAQMNNIDRLFTSAYADVNSKDTAAGFQIALWEIMTDTGTTDGLDLATGKFITTGTGTHYDLAAGYLAGLGAAGTGGYTLTTYFSDASQDLVSGTLAPVPLPASSLLLLAGVGGLVGMRRRKKA